MPETTLCANCSAAVTQQDAFCPQCGTGTAWQSPAAPPPPPPPQPPTNSRWTGLAAETSTQARPDFGEPGTAGYRNDPPVPPPTPPPHYGSSPPGSQRFEPQQTTTTGLFAGLFDFSFTHLITTKVIKFVYAVAAALLVLAWIFWLYTGFNYSFGLGLLVLVLGPIVALFYLVLYRIVFELVMVIFKIGEDVQTIREHRALE